MLVTQGNVAALFRGYSVLFAQALAASAKPVLSPLLMDAPSTGIVEQHNWLRASNGIRELVDEAAINDLEAQDYSIANKEYEETLTLKQIEIATDRYGILAPRIQILAANAAYFPDELLVNLFVKGLDGTGLDYTGSAFFDTNKRASAESTAFTNVGTAALDSNGVALSAAKQNLLSRVNAKGRPMNLGTDLVVIHSAKNADLVTRLLKGDNLAVVGNNAAAFNPYKGSARNVCWPQLDASGLEDAWFLADFGTPLKPFIKQTLIPWTYYTVDNPQSEFVLRFHKFLYQIYGALGLGYGFPEVIYGSDGSA